MKITSLKPQTSNLDNIATITPSRADVNASKEAMKAMADALSAYQRQIYILAKRNWKIPTISVDGLEASEPVDANEVLRLLLAAPGEKERTEGLQKAPVLGRGALCALGHEKDAAIVAGEHVQKKARLAPGARVQNEARLPIDAGGRSPFRARSHLLEFRETLGHRTVAPEHVRKRRASLELRTRRPATPWISHIRGS